MYSKYRPLLPQIATEPNTKGKSTPITDVALSNCLVLFVQVALVGAFILQTSFDKRTRVLLYTHDVVQSGPHSHQSLVIARNKHKANLGKCHNAATKVQRKNQFCKKIKGKLKKENEKIIKTVNIWQKVWKIWK